MTETSPRLFSPLKIRDVTFQNRIMVSPMSTYSAIDGYATDWHFAHYAKFAAGGAGLVCIEATKVDRNGVGSMGDMGLWQDELIAPVRRIADIIRSQGSVSGIQLNHSGRKAGTARPWEGFGPLDRSVKIEGRDHWPVVGPSAIPYQDDWPVPLELTQDGIKEVVDAFAQAARRANDANIDVLEIHGAHGYLIHEFLSPAANQRKDRYGGSLENRMRFALEVTEAIRRNWPAGKPLFFRVSAQDESGWTLENSIVLARELKPLGVDAIACSSGGINVRSPTAAKIAHQLGFQVPFAEAIRREAGIMTIAVGLIVKARQAEAILEHGQADIVALGREMLYNPFWAIHAAAEFGVDPEFKNMPKQYGWWLARRANAGYK